MPGEQPAPPRAVVAAEEQAIADERHDRQHDPGLLGGAGRQHQHRADDAPADPCDARAQREQRAVREGGHEDVGPRAHVADRLAHHRMHGEERGRHERDHVGLGRRGHGARAPVGGGAPHEREQQHRVQRVQQDAGEVVAARGLAPERVIDRERDVHQRPEEVLADEGQEPGAVDERGIAHDTHQIVVDEGVRQRVEIDEDGQVGGERPEDQPLRPRGEPHNEILR